MALIRPILAAVLCAGLAAGPAAAQSWTASGESIEDLRYRLGLIDAELQDIRARLGSVAPDDGTGDASASPGGGASGDVLVRLDRLEAEIRRLTGTVERLEFRQRRMAEDAARRFGDVEFRLTELEGGDVTALAPQRPLGGVGAAEDGGTGAGRSEPGEASPDGRAAAGPSGQGAPGARELASTAPAGREMPDALGAGIEDVQQGRFEEGEARLAGFLEDNPDSALAPRAHYWLGQSHFVRGDFREAARVFLAGYNDAPSGDMASRNLLQLGVTLGRLGQTREACLTLREVRNRFPDGDRDVLTAADVEADNLACGGG